MHPHSESERLLADLAWVQGLARSLLQDEHLAADLSQDVLAAVIERPPAFTRDQGRLRAWLGGVTKILASRQQSELRERRRREATVARPEASNAEEQANERLRLHQQLTQAVMALAEPYRSTLVLRFFDGLPPGEIAKRKGITAGTARQHLSRGLAQVRKRLEGEYPDRRALATALVGLAKLEQSATPLLAGGAITLLSMNKLAAIGLLLAVLALGFWFSWAPLLGVDLNQAEQPAASQTPIHSDQDSKAVADPGQARTALAVYPAAATPFRIAVSDSAGTPVFGARVWSLVDGGRMQTGRTNGEGVLALSSLDKNGHVLVSAKGFPPVAREFESMTGRKDIALHGGSELQGWIRVDGQLPRELIWLEIEFVGAVQALGLPALFEDEAANALDDTAHVRTDASGQFHFQGLPATWTGSLVLPQQYWFRDRRAEPGHYGRLLLDGPATGLQLEATSLPLVSGRLIWEGSGDPVSSASVSALVRFSDGDLSPSTNVQVDAEGRFRIGLTPGGSRARDVWLDPESRVGFGSIRISINAPGARLPKTIVFDSANTPSSGDVGDITLPRTRSQEVHFLVENNRGEAIPGARILAKARDTANGERLARQVSKITTEDGRCLLAMADPLPNTWLVGGPGYRIDDLRAQSGTGSTDDPFRFVLSPGNSLTIRLKDPNGLVPPRIHLTLQAKNSIFPGSEGQQPTRLHSYFGSRIPGYGYGKDHVEVSMPPNGNGEATLTSLLPDVALTLVIRDALNQILVQKEIIGPGPEEQKQIEVLVPQARCSLVGRVLDERNRPLANALLSLKATEPGSLELRSDSEGRFRFDNLYRSELPVTLTVERREYVVMKREGIALQPGASPLELQMSPGHHLRIRVVDPKGESVPVSDLQVDLPEHQRRHRSRSPGVFDFDTLPAGTQRFSCKIGNQEFELRHDPQNSEATFVIPRPGVLQFKLPAIRAESGKDLKIEIRNVSNSSLVASVWGYGQSDLERERLLLLPGEYEVRLLENSEQGTVARKPGESKLCKVTAGERTLVLLGEH